MDNSGVYLFPRCGDVCQAKVMHEIYTEKRRLSTTYPHGFPHSVENYMGVIHPQAVDNVVDKSWLSGG